MAEREIIRVRWSGEIRHATVIQRYKNGNLRVEIHRSVAEATAASAGGIPGRPRVAKPIRVRIEPWQVIPKIEDLIVDADTLDEVTDVSGKFGEQRDYPGMNGHPLTEI